MTPKFRAWGVERYPGLKQPASKMHRNVSVVTTYPEGITFILTNFSMWGDDEYSGSIIDDAILMQSTGLKDKNGKEIFEGDILGTKDGLLNGVVEYRSDLGMWINNLIRYNNFERLCNVANSREIIGNVWEEGDLIDGKNTSEN